MGLFRGAMTYRRFFVRGEIDATPEELVEAIGLRTFRPLDPSEDLDERAGWCACDNPFHLEPGYEDVFLGDYVNLGLRVDTWRIPRSLLRAELRDAERSVLAQSGEAKLSRAKKKNLEAVIKARLRRKLIPSMRSYELSWHRHTGELRFFCTSAKIIEHLVELFGKTFGCELDADGLYLSAEHRALPKTLLSQIPKLEPLDLIS